jgi:predicted RecB family endonuclease
MEATSAQRVDAAQLLSTAPADALASYFALEHDAKRTRLYLRADRTGRTQAFVAVCQTGLDLFRPMVVMRAADDAALLDALGEALVANRHYLLSAPPSLRPVIDRMCVLNGESVNAVYTLSRADFKPVVNLLVVTSKTPDGLLRASIGARDGSNAAEAGTSWISTRYGEVFVNVHESLRNRGLGKSVVSSVCTELLERKRTPLYVTRTDNSASRKLAERLGFVDTSAFELTGQIRLSS